MAKQTDEGLEVGGMEEATEGLDDIECFDDEERQDD